MKRAKNKCHHGIMKKKNIPLCLICAKVRLDRIQRKHGVSNRKRAWKEFAKKLNSNIPKSEKWFLEYYENIIHWEDKFNVVYSWTIPDVLNLHFKYVVEVDGSIHDLPEIQERDRVKNQIYKKNGLKVIRIKAFDIESLKLGLISILEARNYRNAHITIIKDNNTFLEFKVGAPVKRPENEMFGRAPPKRQNKKPNLTLTESDIKTKKIPTVILRKINNSK